MYHHISSLIPSKIDIFCKNAKRIADIYDDGVYEGPAKVKEVNIVTKVETPKPNVDLAIEKEQQLVPLLKEYQDCFAWLYEDMKGIPP